MNVLKEGKIKTYAVVCDSCDSELEFDKRDYSEPGIGCRYSLEDCDITCPIYTNKIEIIEIINNKKS